ncbi:MAG: hypothetical protein AAFX03_07495 [Pseudomonadota bacterium]
MKLTYAIAGLVAIGGIAAACSNRGAADPDPRPWAEVLAEDGLAAAERNLESQTETPETGFLLGGVRFLRAQEVILQIRYANHSGSLAFLPGMRAELPANMDGAFDPAFLERAMAAGLRHLGEAEAALEAAAEGEFAAEVPLDAIWFDIDLDGERAEWESLFAIMGGLGAAPEDGFDGVIRFDTADADWLAAYVHVMSGMAELTLALDPTPAIEAVFEGRQTMEAFGPVQGTGFVGDDTLPDTIAAVVTTFRGVPDAARTRAAHAHFKQMIAHNRAFWSKVAAETDNDREWLPNASQTSAFGVTVDEETAQGWQDVLTEIEAILDGEALVPYWRVSNEFGVEEGVGINIRKVFENPGDMDLILWVQGAAAAPYLERGRLANLEAWNRFTTMTRGDSLMLAAWFN